MFRLLIFTLLTTLVVAEKINYRNYQVFHVTPQNDQQLDILTQLSLLHTKEFNFWTRPTSVNQTVDLMVSPVILDFIHNIINKYSLPYSIHIKDVQTLIDKENPHINDPNEEYRFDRYYKLEEIYDQLDVLEKQYAGKVKVIVAGSTYEKREIKGVKLSFGENNPAVVIEGGIHAREWISPATVMYLMHQLLTSQNPDIRAMAEAYDWYMFPSVNPDGYVYTHTSDRLWRKTRTPYGLCRGADPNRNWDYKWMHGGASSSPCDETYAGKKPFSEVETRTFSEFLTTLNGKMFAYISFHSYSQLLLFPYGHTQQHLDNYDELYAIGKKTITALSKRYGTKYVTGNIAETIYIASGSSMDWVKGTFKVPITYTYELRDTGGHGFILPAEQIIPNGEEVVDSLIVLFQEANKYGYPSSTNNI